MFALNYEVEGKLIIKLKEGHSVDQKKVRKAVEEEMRMVQTTVAYVFNPEGGSEFFELEKQADLEELMKEAPIRGGHSRKSRQISAQNMD
ncbi:hypothetical protein DXT76_01120 [Halobacillus trueperi]|uniref:Uncharacterized protein n=1 Tax=Halobacillus trueperi TaxID=156205 RepID=A0A3D8VTH6_9BACI|nr:hypothetical protein [Halobacillus trueperi]RDY72571.1 hypothetical protein DXT76_01120 [Halobacillus trueperi]